VRFAFAARLWLSVASMLKPVLSAGWQKCTLGDGLDLPVIPPPLLYEPGLAIIVHAVTLGTPRYLRCCRCDTERSGQQVKRLRPGAEIGAAVQGTSQGGDRSDRHYEMNDPMHADGWWLSSLNPAVACTHTTPESCCPVAAARLGCPCPFICCLWGRPMNSDGPPTVSCTGRIATDMKHSPHE
jgi:hypothetical protein